jgi:hypothetical protein
VRNIILTSSILFIALTGCTSGTLFEPSRPEGDTCKEECAHHMSNCAGAGATCDENAERTCMSACKASGPVRTDHGKGEFGG